MPYCSYHSLCSYQTNTQILRYYQFSPLMSRKAAVSVQPNHPLSGRRSSFKLRQTANFFPRTNLLNKISQLSPEKIIRSSSTKLSSRLSRNQHHGFQGEPYSSLNQKQEMQQPKVSESKTSKKPLGAVKAFGTNLLNNQGSFNETRISIVTSMKHQNVEFENISLFAVFEGHNGNECSTFLRDNLHVFIAMEKSFPEDIPKAMADGIAVAEQEFMKFARKTLCDAGSSLVVAIVKDDTVYIANVGDCRAVGSLRMGEQSINLTVDHTAHTESQFNRILKKGGSISKQREGDKIDFYVLPGYKRTTRSLGDYYYKNKYYGILVNEPSITQKKITLDLDFILLGSDLANRLFGFTNAKQVVKNLWVASINDESESIHGKVGQLIKYLLGNASKEVPSIGAIVLAFEGYEKTFGNQQPDNLPVFGQ